MNVPAKYQACTSCTAKWFGPAGVSQCPRCGATTMPAVDVAPPFCGAGSQRLTPEMTTLLEAVPANQRVTCLVESMGQAPPWSAGMVVELVQQFANDFPETVAATWWSRVPLALQQPLRHSTLRLLDLVARKPSRRHLQILMQHLQQRCQDGRLIAVQRVYRAVIRLLRHQSSRSSIRVDPAGWVCTDELLERINRRALDFELWRDWTVNDLQRQADLSSGRRIQISSDRICVRALYGHTLTDICPGVRRTPREALYHGTSRPRLDEILQKGLLPGKRNLTQLTSSFDYANWVARTHVEAIVLHVNADAAVATGIPFWQCNDHVWQCTHVPAAAISVAPQSRLHR